MPETTLHPELASLERATFQRTLDHGLYDLGIACMLLVFAVGPYTTSAGLGDFWGTLVFVPFWAVAALALRHVHRHVVAPRLGFVAFAPPRRRRLRSWHRVSLVVAAIALGVGSMSASLFGLLPPAFHIVALSLFVFVGFALGGYYLDSPRFYVYAVVIASAPATGELLWRHAGAPHHGFPITFGFAAALCLAVGLGLLTTFVSRHPLPPDEGERRGA